MLKKILVAVVLIAIAVGVVSFFYSDIAEIVAIAKLETAFAGSSVSIENVVSDLSTGLTFNGIVIKGGNYEISIEEAGFRWALSPLPIGRVRQAYIGGAECRYARLVIKDISANIRMDKGSFAAEDISGTVFGGKLTGTIGARFDEDDIFYADLRFNGIRLLALAEELEFADKIELSGSMNGNMAIEARGTKVASIDGRFDTSREDNVFNIKDTSYLEKITGQTQQPADILVESLKDYRYNTGTLKLGLEGPDILLDINMDGDQGKRDLTVVLHDTL